MDNTYPKHLVPKKYYLPLKAALFAQIGYVARCLKEPAEFDPTGMLLEKSFSFPQTDSLVRHLSVSLLGDYRLEDTAWQFSIRSDSSRLKQFDETWVPGQDGLYPTQHDAAHPERGNWGYFWIPLVHLHNKEFKVGDDTYRCCVIHEPVKRNYWHFELHFFNDKNEDLYVLHKNNKLSSRKVKGIATGIRALLLTVSKAHDIQTVGWPKHMYQRLSFWQLTYSVIRDSLYKMIFALKHRFDV